jgi:hypothetical protein
VLFLLSPEVELGIGAEANWIDEVMKMCNRRDS